MTPPAEDPVDELLAACLQAEDPAAAVGQAASSHPQHASELRQRWEFLVAARAPGTTKPGQAGGRLGRFRLIEKVGGGGMGIVYRAIEDPPGREVALKLVRPEHLWFEGSHRRFLREVETVAAMQHPGIVPVYSCGEHDGVPFCAMEYVRGRSLADVLEVLRRNQAPPDVTALRQDGARDWNDACFRLALQVAEALAHVHARGVVHRDVKPSNILLDDAGRARLIDFGLARVTHGESLTRTGVQPGSLAYMSPEQVRGDDVDARTDVWSLGVTLHELLTLQQPFVRQTEEATRRAIMAGVAPQASSSGTRVPWDAATVVATAMAPERDRRYQTMPALADDLRAFLERRPIAARRPGPWLRTRRWTQRHPVASVTIALLVVLLGVLPSTLLLRERAAREEIGREAERARTAEQASAREAATAERVVQFLQELFYEVDPSRARGATVPARVILDRGVRRIRSELYEEPAVRAALLRAMGIVYLNLGLVAESEDLLLECQRICEQERLGDKALRAVRVVLARNAAAQGRTAEAERLLRDLLRDAESGTRAGLLAELAEAVWHQDRNDEALRLYDEALALMRARDRDDADLLAARRSRAGLLLHRLDPSQALSELREVHRIMQQGLRQDDPALIHVTRELAEAELENGNAAAAEARLREVEQVAAKVFDANHPSLAMLRENLAQVLLHQGRFPAALAELDRALAAYVATYQEPHRAIAQARNLESTLAYEIGDLARAERAARAALKAFEQLFPKGSHDRALALGNLARVLLFLGSLREGEALAAQAVAMQEVSGHTRPEIDLYARALHGYALAMLNRGAEAERRFATVRERLSRTRDLRVRAHAQCYAAEALLLVEDSRPEQAIQLARAAEQDWQASGSEPGIDWARRLQGWAQTTLGNPKEAERILRPVLERQRRALPAGHPYLALTTGDLAVAVLRQQPLREEGLELLHESVAIRRESGGPDNVTLALPLLNLGMACFLVGRHDESSARGLEVLAILRANSAQGHRLVKNAVQLLLRTLPQHPDAEKRRQGFAALREGADALLPKDDPLCAAVEKAAAGNR
jgi:tetratricopeptide (TPR) repeat protein/tRNA A-37 threonylcarbamoyl transferase component Bud32